MNGNDIRQNIASALASFPQRPLPDAASELFSSLGYGSERRIKFPTLAARVKLKAGLLKARSKRNRLLSFYPD